MKLILLTQGEFFFFLILTPCAMKTFILTGHNCNGSEQFSY